MNAVHTLLMMDTTVVGSQNEAGYVSKAIHELFMRLTWLAEMHAWIMYQAY